MQTQKTYSPTLRLKNANFRGQRALVVEAVAKFSAPATLEALMPIVDKNGRYLALLSGRARENGGVKGSVLYHLKALKKLGMIKETSSSPSARVQVVGWGNSQAVRIPKAMLDELQIREGDEVELRIENGRLAIEPVEKKITLESLLAGITPENRHKEVDWGPAVGNEVW
jgi:antitoxin MazE